MRRHTHGGSCDDPAPAPTPHREAPAAARLDLVRLDLGPEGGRDAVVV